MSSTKSAAECACYYCRVRNLGPRKAGRYAGQFDEKCVCGHGLGLHVCDVPHPCGANPVDDKLDACECMAFRPANTSPVGR